MDKNEVLYRYENLKLYNENQRKEIVEAVRDMNLKTEEEIEEKLENILKEENEEEIKLINNCKEASDDEILEMFEQIDNYYYEIKKLIIKEVDERKLKTKEEIELKIKEIDEYEKIREMEEEKGIKKPISMFRVFLLIIAGINIFQIVAGINFNGLFLAIVIFVIYILLRR